jgi:hypothetical protein
MANVFATELCDSGGTLWLGGYDETHVTGPVQYVPMNTTSPNFMYGYVIDLAQIVVAGSTVSVAAGSYSDALVDTGTSDFVLNADAFDAVTAAIAKDPAFQGLISASPSWFDNIDCVSITQTKAELDAMLPTMTLVFDANPPVSVEAVATESYLFSQSGAWCPALLSASSDSDFPWAAILGSPVLKSSVTVVDREHSRVGFAPHAPCP